MVNEFIEKQLDAKEVEWRKMRDNFLLDVKHGGSGMHDPLYEKNLIAVLLEMMRVKSEICKLRELKEVCLIQSQLSEGES